MDMKIKIVPSKIKGRREVEYNWKKYWLKQFCKMIWICYDTFRKYVYTEWSIWDEIDINQYIQKTGRQYRKKEEYILYDDKWRVVAKLNWTDMFYITMNYFKDITEVFPNIVAYKYVVYRWQNKYEKFEIFKS